MARKEMRKLKGSGHGSGQGLLTINSMQLRRDMSRDLENIKTKVIVGDRCSIGYVAKIIVRRFFHCTGVVGLISIVIRRCKQLGMLVIAFLKFMSKMGLLRKL